MNSSLSDDKIDKHLDNLSKSQSLESYCTNCGACCRPSVLIKSSTLSPFKILVKGLSCKFNKSANEESLCTVYEDRFEKASWCLDLKGMIKEAAAPSDCPYVEGLEGYKPTLELSDKHYNMVSPLLKKAIVGGDTSPFSELDVNEFLKK